MTSFEFKELVVNVTKVLLPNSKLVFVPVKTTSNEVYDSAREGLIDTSD
jgi:hypothetical protein